MAIALTGSGTPITCDGCGALVEAVPDAMAHLVPHEVARTVYGSEDLVYIVCAAARWQPAVSGVSAARRRTARAPPVPGAGLRRHPL